VWQWGQFLDHDLSLTVEMEPAESMDIPIPKGDRFFDPDGEGGRTIRFRRSAFRMTSGSRQQVNSLSAYIDASHVYGSDPERARALRSLDGTGRLAVSSGDLLPFNTGGFDNGPSPDPTFFLAGDVRANEQLGLTALHVLFVREHNFWADFFRGAYPGLDDDAIYERSRALVAAEMQAITYNEFLPVLLGPDALPPYRGYDPSVNAGVSNEFAAAAFRVGHSMLPPELLRLDPAGQRIASGHVALADAFFAPQQIIEHGIDPLLRGLLAQPAQEVDPHIVDGVRNFLFGAPGSGGFDLASLNLQRGRDHGLASFNEARRELGLRPVSSFAEINSDPKVQENLALAFVSVEEIDLWMGGLSEAHVPGALVGETFRTILVDQFRRSRDGDRFWYEIYLPPELVAVVRRQTLASVLARNTQLGAEIVPDVFYVPAL
jgi:hypothetical protein